MQITIQNATVLFGETDLAKLNTQLASLPVVKSTYNNKTEKYDSVVRADLKLQLEPITEVHAIVTERSAQ